MKMRSRYSTAFLAILMVLGQSGCASKSGVDPIATSNFVDGSKMYEDPSLPFQKVWRNPDFARKGNYKKLYVAPVNTDYMFSVTEWPEGVPHGDFKKQAEEIAGYMQNAIKKAFREDPNARFTVVDEVPNTPDAVILESAITEIVPSKVVLNALQYAPFGIGLGIKLLRKASNDQKSTIAIEVRLRDAATGTLLLTMADRRGEQSSLVSLRGLTWYSHVYHNIDEWSKEFVIAANRKHDEDIKGVSSFTLKPW